MRQIVLDTETTGLSAEAGHCIVEIGGIEIIDRELTKKVYHQYLNPQRPIDQEALAIHGLSNDFLADKPTFPEIVDSFLVFLEEAHSIIIHNAPFDLLFFHYALTQTARQIKPLSEQYTIIDTLTMARTLHPGQRNSLDALCKRYHVDNTQRHFHGALLDAHLLAHVYLKMTGGQSSFFDLLEPLDTIKHSALAKPSATHKMTSVDNLIVLKANREELKIHQAYLENMLKQGQCLWRQNETLDES